MTQAAAVAYDAFGLAEADRVGESMPVIGGRLFVDMTAFARARAGRAGLVGGMRTQQGSTAAAGLAAVLEDPRFAPTRRLPVRLRGVAPFLRRLGPSLTSGTARALARPAAARARAFAAAEAEATLDDLVERARGERPLRARLAGFCMRRARALSGLRELPKSAWSHLIGEVREQLLAVGAELAAAGRLDTAEDVLFLEVLEVRAAVDGGVDHRALVAQRRAEHAREQRRPRVPELLLSDGAEPELLAPEDGGDGALRGTSGAPGRVTGTARMLSDPSTARLDPGDVLVAATTDPGWTHLFLTAGGVVTESGGPNAHGPTVAR